MAKVAELQVRPALPTPRSPPAARRLLRRKALCGRVRAPWEPFNRAEAEDLRRVQHVERVR